MSIKTNCGLYGVTVKAVLVKNNKFLIMKRSAYRNNPYEWDLPGGCLHLLEDPNKGLIREVYEETGFKIKILRILEAKTRFKDTVFITYLVKPVKGKLKLSEEHIEAKWCPITKKEINNIKLKSLIKKAKK